MDTDGLLSFYGYNVIILSPGDISPLFLIDRCQSSYVFQHKFLSVYSPVIYIP